ncbi:MAG: hypothetical protein HUN04_21760 [Desulfobacter sp.]|nr:MAG: hypothetical protein HUN04_21760 [Desulfobacter sp.]
MIGMIKKSVFVSAVLMAIGGTAWGGWFSFEPNILIVDGTPVAREFEDIQKETTYLEKGDTAMAEQLVRDSRVIIIDSQKYDNRVEYVKYKEQGNSVFVLVKDESGSKMWANMIGLACKGNGGSERPVSKEDLAKGKLTPLAD